MSVVLETTLGDITVDLFTSDRPRACLNFLKLCKIKYYNYNLFHTISRGFIAQTGDPTGSRNGGESIYGVLDGLQKRYFEGENEPRIKHTKMGLISFVGNDDRMIGSQFFLTLGEDLTYLDEKHCVFGEVVEGLDILEIINEVICDNDDRPYQDVRITHTVILDDPFPNPKKLRVPSRSPSPSIERLKGGRIAPDEEIDELEGKTPHEIAEMQAEREAKARATILEMVGDIPDAEMAPPENVLFVCKLNPVTSDDDLEIIFSRFGKIKSCEVIRDKKTGDSLQYAFVEFEDKVACENAYFKMDNVLIDDRRIHVDFSQSVSKVKWRGKGRGVTHYDERGKQSKHVDTDIGKGNYKHKRNSNSYKSNKSDKTLRQRSKSPNANIKYKDSSRHEREKSSLTQKDFYDNTDYLKKLKRTDGRSNRSRREKSISSSPERRVKHTKSSSNKNEQKAYDRNSLRSYRDKSVTPKRRKGSSSPPRRNKSHEEKISKYKERSASPRSKKYSSDEYDRTNSKGNRSTSPKNNKGRSEKFNRNVETSQKTFPGQKSDSRKRSSSKDAKVSKPDRYNKSLEKHTTKIHSDKKRSYTPERKNYSSTSSSKNEQGHDFDKEKEPKNKKRKKKSKCSSSDSDNNKKQTKETTETESSDSDHKKYKSKKKKSVKNKYADSSSDSDDYKRKSRKKKKYESDTD